MNGIATHHALHAAHEHAATILLAAACILAHLDHYTPRRTHA